MNVNHQRRRFLAALARYCGWIATMGSTSVLAVDDGVDIPAADPFPPLARIVTGGAAIRAGRVFIDTPRLADNGHSVPITVRVDSAMTLEDHVRRIALVSESNPRPLIATFHLSPQSGRAEIMTRVRLNKSQRLMALAELSDGTFWSGTAAVIVTESACLDAD